MSKKRILILSVIFALLLAVSAASAFVALNSVHVCDGAGCEICALISNIRKLYDSAVFAAALFLGSLALIFEKDYFQTEKRDNRFSLVSEKVKLSD